MGAPPLAGVQGPSPHPQQTWLLSAPLPRGQRQGVQVHLILAECNFLLQGAGGFRRLNEGEGGDREEESLRQSWEMETVPEKGGRGSLRDVCVRGWGDF